MKLTRILAALAALALATSARANFEVGGKVTCYAANQEKLAKGNSGDETLVALCLGVPENDPNVASYALVFGNDPRELRVVRRCDSMLVCVLSSELACNVAGPSDDTGFKHKAACVHGFNNVGVHTVNGSLFCSEQEQYKVSSNKYGYKTSCDGQLAIDENQTCAIHFKSGKEFEESGTCP